MKVYEYRNATVYVRGEVDKEKLRNATIRFFKNAQKCKVLKERIINGN